MEKLKDFFLNKALGKVIVRVSAALVSYLASGQLGFALSLDPNEVALALNAGVQALISLVKHKKPA